MLEFLNNSDVQKPLDHLPELIPCSAGIEVPDAGNVPMLR
jgi:hypothetical protein